MKPSLYRVESSTPSVLWLAVLLVVGTGTPRLTFGEDRFVPDQHLPEGALLYVRADITCLAREFKKTPFGKIVSHPGSVRAVGRLPSFVAEKIDEAADEFRKKTGMDLLEALELFRGEVAIAQYDFRPERPPTTVFAVELGEQKEGIRQLLDGITKSWKEDGKEPDIVDIDGVKAESWPVIRHGDEVDSFVSVELGSHLLASLGKPTRFEAAVRRFKGQESGAGGIGEQPAMKSALEDCAVTDRALVAAVDVSGFLAFLEEASVGFKPGAPDELIPSRVITLLGLRNATSLGYALGFHGGDFEGRLRLTFADKSDGVLRAIADAVAPVRAADEALAKIPVGASAVATKSVALGKLYTRCVAEVKTHFPEHFEDFQDVLRTIEQALGISFDEDVASLGRADWYAFSMDPPAGSLFADGFALVRKSEFAAYRTVLEKVARASEAELTAEVAGTTVNFAPFRIPQADEDDPLVWFGIASWCDLDDEWTLVANRPQAIRRFLEYYATEKPLATDAAVSALVKEMAGADVGVVVRRGPNLISRYNDVVTLLQALAPMFSKFLDSLDVEVAHLPIGEEFLDAISDGTIRVEFTSSHIDLHGRAVTTAVAGSPAGFAVVGVGAIAAGVLVPTWLHSRSEQKKRLKGE